MAGAATTSRAPWWVDLLKTTGVATAVLASLMVAVGYIGKQSCDTLLPRIAAFIDVQAKATEQNADNVATLAEAQSQSAEEHAAMLLSLRTIAENQNEITERFVETLSLASDERKTLMDANTTLQQVLAQREVEHQHQTEALKELLSLVQSAHTMMNGVPELREQELEVLNKIQVGIEQLAAQVQAANGEVEPAEPE